MAMASRSAIVGRDLLRPAVLCLPRRAAQPVMAKRAVVVTRAAAEHGAGISSGGPAPAPIGLRALPQQHSAR